MKKLMQSLRLQFALFSHFFNSYISLINGVWRISRLSKPVITIFGGSKMEQNNYYAQQAHALGTLLVDKGMSVITGGGPGIMEAANCGAYASSVRPSGIRSIGIEVTGLQTEKINRCADKTIVVEQFAIRKWLLIHYAAAFVVFPGGFGTLDELFEVATLIETGFLEQTPIILFGKDYWQTIIDWQLEARKLGLIEERHLKLFYITDDYNDTCKYITDFIETHKETVL